MLLKTVSFYAVLIILAEREFFSCALDAHGYSCALDDHRNIRNYITG